MGADAHLKTLSTAKAVAFGGVGVAGIRLPETEAYFAVEERLAAEGEKLRPELERLLKKATPAGRVYAAELLNRVGREAGAAARERLLRDKDQVTTYRGCFMESTTVAAYAESWLRVE